MVDALETAKNFHETYERLAPQFGYETRPDTKAFDPESKNGKLMLAVCEQVGNEIEKAAFYAGFQAGLRERSASATQLPPPDVWTPERGD